MSQAHGSRAERAQTQRLFIAGAAHRLFLDQGFERTSYQDIAVATGLERTLVQYYFPKKEGLVISLMDRALRAAERAAAPHSPPEGVFVQLYLVAQVYFGLLLDPRTRALALDVVSSRRMTDEIILFDEGWLRERLDDEVDNWSQFTDDMTMAVGGAYELCYQALANDRELDSRDLSLRLLVAFMASAGIGSADAGATLSASRLDDGELREAVTRVVDSCYGPARPE